MTSRVTLALFSTLTSLSGQLATCSDPGSSPEGREFLIHNSSVASPVTSFPGSGHMSTFEQVTEMEQMKSVGWPDLGYILTF